MKKLTFVLLFGFITFINSSCDREDVETNGQILLADLAATSEAFLTAMETGAGELCPPCAYGAATIVGMIASNEESQNQGQHKIGVAESTVTLPSSLLVPENEFECIGIIHNKLLYRNTQEDRVHRLSLLKNNDSVIINESILEFSLCKSLSNSEQEGTRQLFQSTFTPVYYQQNISSLINMSKEEMVSKINSANRPETPYLKIVLNTVLGMQKDKATKISVVEFLNQKIREILNENEVLSMEQKSKLVFMTILKHSYYFWEK